MDKELRVFLITRENEVDEIDLEYKTLVFDIMQAFAAVHSKGNLHFITERERAFSSESAQSDMCFITNFIMLEWLDKNLERMPSGQKIIAPITTNKEAKSDNVQNAIASLKKRGVIFVDYACNMSDDFTSKACLQSLAFEIIAAANNHNFAFYHVPLNSEPGGFGVKRRHHYHTGVDLYVHRDNAIVYPFEDGEIVGQGHFTGKLCGSPWWNDTHYVAVKHGDKVIVYGEINSAFQKDGNLIDCIGIQVTKTTPLGTVIPVTKNRHPEYYHHNTKMLHVEMYNASKFKAAAVDEWELDKKQPDALLDPTDYLLQLLKK